MQTEILPTDIEEVIALNHGQAGEELTDECPLPIGWWIVPMMVFSLPVWVKIIGAFL